MNIGLIGFGGVGKAFVKLLLDKKSKLHNDINLKYIINSKGGIYNREGIDIHEIIDLLDSGESIENYQGWISELSIENILQNHDIEYLIELTSTNIENGEPGISHIKRALNSNINVITGNKGPILIAYKELKKIADKKGVKLMIGCTTGGALPSVNGGIIECAGADILEIQGILNGTTNYILSMMAEKNISYHEALKHAQLIGIAEADPKLDVEGFDTASKILILTNVIMDTNYSLRDVRIQGITEVNRDYVRKLRESNKKLKLIGKSRKTITGFEMSVKLEEIDCTHPLYNVDYKNKGILYKTDTLGDIAIIGGASGTVNAAAAIIRDLVNTKKSENM